MIFETCKSYQRYDFLRIDDFLLDVNDSPMKSSSHRNSIPQVLETENKIEEIINEWLSLEE